MEKQYTIVDAKNKLPALIHSAESGQEIKLTRHGKTVAVLLSIKDYERMKRKREGYWQALNSFRSRFEKEHVLIGSEEFDGLRDKSPGREVELWR
jgi:prevent-host-death family protein